MCDYSEKIEREKERVILEWEGFDRWLVAKRGIVVQKGLEIYSRVEIFRKEGRLFWMDWILGEIAEVKIMLADT